MDVSPLYLWWFVWHQHKLMTFLWGGGVLSSAYLCKMSMAVEQIVFMEYENKLIEDRSDMVGRIIF